MGSLSKRVLLYWRLDSRARGRASSMVPFNSIPQKRFVGGSQFFLEDTFNELGLEKNIIPYSKYAHEWDDYVTLDQTPDTNRSVEGARIYRGIVPAKNILKRDFAINGAIVRAHYSSTIYHPLIAFTPYSLPRIMVMGSHSYPTGSHRISSKIHSSISLRPQRRRYRVQSGIVLGYAKDTLAWSALVG